jgi:hypothetical protein
MNEKLLLAVGTHAALLQTNAYYQQLAANQRLFADS